jgi:3-methylcrotonyl-CoA carboxylase alpha subunit
MVEGMAQREVRPIRTLLIANRGEIACRVMRTARCMGMRTVAVHSIADSKALHVRLADQAVMIGGAAAADSYLRGDIIIKAALETGADAIHPGYGFLSENAAFAEAVEAAGLIFVGPRAASIRAMGMKDAAKRLMEKAGVPVVPGYHGDAQDIVVLAGKAGEIGYPVLIKAAAGGGGKGMRLVEKPSDFREALASAKREAKSAFGDDKVLVEKFIANPRHIEVQVFGDEHGNTVHLFERDCSAQRRHQKVIEEAPAPGMTETVREAMTQAAVKAAKAINYRGAGTIEFIADGSGELRSDGFWFMEMNTRLQVEHPVTEEVTGVDLVAWQLLMAQGEPLPLAQDAITLNGHAFEARLYAENPANGFLPATGTLHHLRLADGARIETGVSQGDEVTPWYDPMIAKIITRGDTRDEALARLRHMLQMTEVAGVVTNCGFLARLAGDADFASGRVDTGMIARLGTALTNAPPLHPALIARAMLAASEVRLPETMDAWDTLAGYRHFGNEPLAVRIDGANGPVEASIEVKGDTALVTLASGQWRLPLPNQSGQVAGTTRFAGQVAVFDQGNVALFSLHDPFAASSDVATGGKMTAPMPGIVKMVFARIGERVAKGARLLVLEAMKMEHAILADHDGVVEAIATEGDQVKLSAVLATLTASAVSIPAPATQAAKG